MSTRVSIKIGAIGLGALGSQIFSNLIRAGFGEWVLIDYDIILPHNLARHSLPGTTVGLPKAVALSLMANITIDGDQISKYILEDVLNPKHNAEELQKAFNESDIILDTSASVAVARNLSHNNNIQARCISAFFTPSGRDLVILGEPSDRKIRLDLLEMQYYRYLTNNNDLTDHLQSNSGAIRYSNSCRDTSSTISQDFVSLHAAIASANIKKIINDSLPIISIWRADGDSFTVKQYSIEPQQSINLVVGEWKLITDKYLIKKIYALRNSKLPNETGGVLCGSYDRLRKIIYVIDTLPSPPDSDEWPTVYIRGCKGLLRQIKKIQKITLKRLNYIGEWHSHPIGHGCNPSGEDLKAFSWLVDSMDIEGLPALMLIAGDQDQFKFFVGQMK
jgi:proteasome lid subunit RPN8/RPN11